MSFSSSFRVFLKLVSAKVMAFLIESAIEKENKENKQCYAILTHYTHNYNSFGNSPFMTYNYFFIDISIILVQDCLHFWERKFY